MRTLNVWHIDDEDIFRRLFQLFCRRQSLPVLIRSFSSAREALDLLVEAADECLPGLIILDLRMPSFDGFDFLEMLSDARPDHGITLFILSSSTDVHDIVRAHALGASSYFMKDEIEELLAQIDGMCHPKLPTAVGH